MAVKVVNVRTDSYDIFIGRPSKWGNPFVIGKDGNRGEVVKKYETHFLAALQKGDITIEELRDLDGKTLGCFCKPEMCHGDIIAKVAEELCQTGKAENLS